MTASTAPWFPTFRKPFRGGTPLSLWWPWWTTFNQRQSLLRLIAVATEERLPLASLLEAWAADERGIQRRRLQRLAGLLRAGTPLPEAVEQVPGALADEDVLAVRFGAQSGTLTTAVRAAIDSRATPPNHRTVFVKTSIYACIVLVVACAAVVFIQLSVIPTILRIFADHSVAPPELFEWSQQLAGGVAAVWLLIVLVVLLLLWSVFAARPGRFVRHVIIGRLFRAPQELRAAEVLQKLSMVTQAGRPIAGALSTLARYHFDPVLRHKLLFVRNEVEQGADVWQSMNAAGLLSEPERDLMKSSDRLGNRVWALRQVALAKRRQTMRRLEQLSELFLPAVVLVLGAFVLFVALNIFLPLTKLLAASM